MWHCGRWYKDLDKLNDVCSINCVFYVSGLVGVNLRDGQKKPLMHVVSEIGAVMQKFIEHEPDENAEGSGSAEPEGKDVPFFPDDAAKCEEPEPFDGSPF